MGGGAADELDRLDRLQTNMTDALLRMEEDWDEARGSFNWSRSGMEGAFDVTAKTVSNSRTRVNKIMRKMEESRADEIAWEQHGIAMALKTKEQSSENHLDPKRVLPVHRDISEAHKLKVIKAMVLWNLWPIRSNHIWQLQGSLLDWRRTSNGRHLAFLHKYWLLRENVRKTKSKQQHSLLDFRTADIQTS